MDRLQLLRWDFVSSIVVLLPGIAIFCVLPSIELVGLRAISLLFAVTLILSGILSLLNHVFISSPEGHLKRLATSIGFFSCALYYILLGQSTIWVALSWILLFWGIWDLVSAFQGIWIEYHVLRKLIKAYKEGDFPNLPMPFIYVLAEPGFGIVFGHKLITKTICSLAKHRYFPAESGLSLDTPLLTPKRRNFIWQYRYRIAISFLVSDSLRRYPANFRQWIMSQASALILIRTSFEVHEFLMKGFNNDIDSALCFPSAEVAQVNDKFIRKGLHG